MQNNKVYYISRYKIERKHFKKSEIQNNYQMVLTANTVVEECMEDTSSDWPIIKYHFTTIRNIAKKKPGDVIGKLGILVLVEGGYITP